MTQNLVKEADCIPEPTGNWRDAPEDIRRRRKFELEEARHETRIKHIYMWSSHGTLFLVFVAILCLFVLSYGVLLGEGLVIISGALSALLFGGGGSAMLYKHKGKTVAPVVKSPPLVPPEPEPEEDV